LSTGLATLPGKPREGVFRTPVDAPLPLRLVDQQTRADQFHL